MTPLRTRNTEIYLHEIRSDKHGHDVRIATPSHDPERPEREIGSGWFMGDPRGIMIRVTNVPDLRTVANALLEAADKLEAEQR